MNFAYQLLLSSSEIMASALFVLVIRKFKPGQKLILKSVSMSGGERITPNTEIQAAETTILKHMVSSGIRMPYRCPVKDAASKSGIIYHSNMAEMQNMFRPCKNSGMSVFNKNLPAIERQLLVPNASSGIILAHLINNTLLIVW